MMVVTNFTRKLVNLLTNPIKFFVDVQNEGWLPSFLFFLQVTLVISIATSFVNYLGIESTDFSSSYQAQILAYNFLKNLFSYGIYVYLFEMVLIFAFSIPFIVFLAFFLHLIYRLIGGQGTILNAWKAACYGAGPCLLGGFLPYISLFAGFYSFAIQFYLGPMTLYKAKENRAILVFVVFITLTFIEMFVLGTTVGF
ncbi:MAG: YIP1 family protein [Nitrososphaeria archaeon]